MTIAIVALWIVQFGARDCSVEVGDYTFKINGWLDALNRRETSKSACEALDFADWINNNWYIPATGGWRIEVENIEFILPHPKVNYFTTEELFSKFSNGEGEF